MDSMSTAESIAHMADLQSIRLLLSLFNPMFRPRLSVPSSIVKILLSFCFTREGMNGKSSSHVAQVDSTESSAVSSLIAMTFGSLKILSNNTRTFDANPDLCGY